MNLEFSGGIGVEGCLHPWTIYGITSLIAGTSLLCGMFKFRAGN
jgi:hypothetical protein